MTIAVVTGGAGFLGAATVRALERAGHDVHVAGASATTDPLTPARIAALGRFDLLVHCAGGSSVGASVQDPDGELAKTVPPFRVLLEHVRDRSPGARVVLLSSAAVYGNAAEVPIPETARIAPISPYGEHKRLCEELCIEHGRAHGTASTVLRLFSVYGPGLRKQLLWDACRKARAGDLAFGGSGLEERDWLHVDDAAALVVAAAAHASADAPVVNGGSGHGARVCDVVVQICRELGAGDPRFTGEGRAGDPSRYIADITRARALGWTPTIALADGISQYVAWFREHA